MNRNEMVLEILQLYDEIDLLKQKQETKDFNIDNVIEKSSTKKDLKMNELSKNIRFIIAYGKQNLFKNCVYTYYNRVNVSRNKDNTLNITSFETWVNKNAIQKDEIPAEISLQDTIELLKDLLLVEYDRQKDESLKKLLNKEKELLNKENEEEII